MITCYSIIRGLDVKWTFPSTSCISNRIKITIAFQTSYVLTIIAWCWNQRKKSQLTILLRKIQDLQSDFPRRIIKTIVIIICILPFLYSASLIAFFEAEDMKLHFYGFDVKDEWAMLIVTVLKNTIHCILYPCIAHVVALAYCIQCSLFSTGISYLNIEITQCAIENFGIPIQVNILKRKTLIQDILLDIQDIFSVPIFLIIIGNVLMCSSITGWFLIHDWSEAGDVWKIKSAFYVINGFMNLTATLWAASGLNISMNKFKEIFHQKTHKRLLLYDTKEELYLKRDLLEEPDFLLTGCDILSFKRSTILTLLGTLLTYTVLIMNTN
ncbi:hypothetical protein HNY73_008986 [Argiope bruennichi]|uniref:Uncharacterized protein n=1 Tax=Argiope bruennichi TaxID=94029 RepID=A0A8T0FEN2_ARGBR|nr:hypothetical protein HNY73_008986 [Argiope bruennichi]